MELIARDQLGKLHGQINRRKQESLGIDEYEWETSHDERVRESRRERQGKVFSWSKLPPEGHPGYPIRCRCIALPVIDWDRQLGEPEKGSYEDVSDVAPQVTNAAGALNAVMQSGTIKAEQKVELTFVPAKTMKEAEIFARDILGIPHSEMIAEAWAEYCNNPNPREIAKVVGRTIEEEYRKKIWNKVRCYDMTREEFIEKMHELGWDEKTIRGDLAEHDEARKEFGVDVPYEWRLRVRQGFREYRINEAGHWEDVAHE